MKESEDFDIKVGGVEEEPIREKPMPRGIVARGTPMDNDPVIFILQEAYRTINQHASSSLHQEVGGVLVGDVYLCPDSRLHYLVIEAAITARLTKAGGGHVTFTHDTWGEIWQEIDKRFPKKKILGWYHTHPGMSVFLSGADMFVQTNFFSRPWQVALVVEPVRQIAGFFQWRQGKVKQCSGYFEVCGPGQTRSRITWQRPRIAAPKQPAGVQELERGLAKTPRETTRSKQLLKMVSVYAVVVTIALFVIGVLSYGGRPQTAESIAGLGLARSNAGVGVNSTSKCIYVFGGRDQYGKPVIEAEHICFATNDTGSSWQKGLNSTGVHGYMGSVDQGYGIRYCIGEVGEEDSENKVWLSPNFWSEWVEQKEPFKPARGNFTTIGFRDHVYVIGGTDDDGVTDSVARAKLSYRPVLTLSGWNASLPELSFARYDAAVVSWQDTKNDTAFLYVIGGKDENGKPCSSVEVACINMTTGYLEDWREVRSLRIARANSAAVVVDNCIYVAGGIDKDDQVLGSIERAKIDPYSGNLQDWETISITIDSRYALTAIALNSGIYFIGGIDAHDRVLNTVQVISTTEASFGKS